MKTKMDAEMLESVIPEHDIRVWKWWRCCLYLYHSNVSSMS